MTAFDPLLLLSPAPAEAEAAGEPTGPARSAYAQAEAAQAAEKMERAWQWTLNLIETRLGPFQRQRLEAAWRSRAAPWLRGLTLPALFQPSNLPTFQLSKLSTFQLYQLPTKPTNQVRPSIDQYHSVH